MKKISNKLRCKKGISTTISFMIGLAIFFMFVYFFIIITNIYSSTKATRDSIEQGTISTIQVNYKNIYHSNRESYSVGYVPSNKDFKESILIKESDIYKILGKNLGLKKTGDNSYSRIENNKNKVFSIKNVDVMILNKELKSGTLDFVATIKYDFVYHINFIGYKNDLKIPMKINAKYSGKF